MLIARSDTRDGRRLLIVGLEAENVRRLLNDEPIYKKLDEVPGLELDGWDITILGPEDLVRFLAAANITDKDRR